MPNALPLIFATLLCALPAAATSAVVLPVDGAGLLPTLRADLENAVRAALVPEVPDDAAFDRAGRRGRKTRVDGVTPSTTPGSYELSSREDTAAVLSDAVNAGLACSLEEVDCIVRIGVIAGVEEVWAPIATQDGTVLQLRITRVDVGARRAKAIAAGVVVHPAQDDGQTIARVVERLLKPRCTLEVTGPAGAQVRVNGAAVGALPLRAPVVVEPGIREVQALQGGRVVATKTVSVAEGFQTLSLDSSAAPPPTVTPAIAEQPPSSSSPSTSPLVIGGGVALGVGALLAVATGIGVVVVESDLSTPRPGADDPKELQGQRDLGVGLVVGSVVGVVVAVAGGVLLGMGLAQ
ncbi:MAG: hypothetical protein Q8O67_02635 [Deltaproteobacteria bacterium]|nr:hypothetical protein [Deltaproteobacteria bacterium]